MVLVTVNFASKQGDSAWNPLMTCYGWSFIPGGFFADLTASAFLQADGYRYQHDITMISDGNAKLVSFAGVFLGAGGLHYTGAWKGLREPRWDTQPSDLPEATAQCSDMVEMCERSLCWTIFSQRLASMPTSTDIPADLEILTSELPVLRNKLRQLCFWRRVIAYCKVSRFPHLAGNTPVVYMSKPGRYGV